MSDKQRADHIQAKYWNGFLTRTEAQQVFDDTAKVIQAQGQVIQKLDAVVSCIAEKIGLTPQEVNEWVQKQIEKATVKNTEPAQETLSAITSV